MNTHPRPRPRLVPIFLLAVFALGCMDGLIVDAPGALAEWMQGDRASMRYWLAMEASEADWDAIVDRLEAGKITAVEAETAISEVQLAVGRLRLEALRGPNGLKVLAEEQRWLREREDYDPGLEEVYLRPEPLPDAIARTESWNENLMADIASPGRHHRDSPSYEGSYR